MTNFSNEPNDAPAAQSQSFILSISLLLSILIAALIFFGDKAYEEDLALRQASQGRELLSLDSRLELLVMRGSPPPYTEQLNRAQKAEVFQICASFHAGGPIVKPWISLVEQYENACALLGVAEKRGALTGDIIFKTKHGLRDQAAATFSQLPAQVRREREREHELSQASDNIKSLAPTTK